MTKTPAWLNDPTMYHNRGNTTFVGEDSQYGDFFGLDDLFTERKEVVDGMVGIYEKWVHDMKIDGFRIDTMKHVNDEFWQTFSPKVLQYAKDQGVKDFFMFGEVADGTRPLTSHYTTHNDVQAVLDFPFQEAARAFAAKSQPTDNLRSFFRDDDYYTDADSNVYQLPTFLGNHDAGHIGMFLRTDNPSGTPESELLARDQLAHQLMYFSRGNPVVYFGDEQGFTGAGNDQAARQDMWASLDPEYDNVGDDAGLNDNIGSDETPADDNFDVDHPLYEEISGLAQPDQDAPRPAQRRAAAPLLERHGGHLRVLAHQPRRAARVRRRAQQRGDREDRDDPDLHGLDALRPPLRRRAPPRSRATRTATSKSRCRRSRRWSTRRRRSCPRAARRRR